MANFTITISNSLNTFGPAPSDKWNQFNWNAFLWGEGTADLTVAVDKLLTNSLGFSDTIGLQSGKLILNTLSLTDALSSESLIDSRGYNYVFPGGTTNPVNRISTSYSAVSSAAGSWSAVSQTSTTWVAI